MGDEVAWLREEEKDRTEEDHFFAVAKGSLQNKFSVKVGNLAQPA